MGPIKEVPIVINDRRGKNKEVRAEAIPETVVPEAAGNPDEWDDYCYITAMAADQNGQPIPLGRIIGLRGDGMSCFADFIFPQVWQEGFDWMELLKQRLDSFLGCSCTDVKVCPTHIEYMRQWQAADSRRITMASREALPRSMAAFVRKMQEQRPRIVAPGLG